ncbi:hypothetical protein CLV55_1025 [Flavobacterium aciduliphilum]|uniref:Uncharacterized protein n=1 Tax=Flavobacterium aciduliphilum TaxID=1101402 RepID=A0A328YIV4_9FLAO|nr:hypothetical protein CLV55_1025 [Flavobacterium aciduliphilum]
MEIQQFSSGLMILQVLMFVLILIVIYFLVKIYKKLKK